MNINEAIVFEKAVRLLSEKMPVSQPGDRKPVLFHNIRVGVYLYEKGYAADVVITGVLHDALEWADFSEQELREGFGEEVTRLVKANTKDDSIEDKQAKTNELVGRCVVAGENALIVKAADVIDSYKWYSKQGDEKGVAYADRFATAIAEQKPADFMDPIFAELATYLKR